MMNIIKDKIDLHSHGNPDIEYPRKMDEIEIARKAFEAGMRGVVFKSHSRTTTNEVRKINEKLGAEIAYSSLVLNRFFGFDSKSVKKEIDKGVKIVYMPTMDSVSHSDNGISILENNELKKEIIDILKLIARHNIVLATGHVPNNELKILVKRAKELEVNKILLTHPDLKINRVDTNLQKELTKEGVFFERTFYSCINPDWVSDEVDNRHGFLVEKGQKYFPEKLKDIVKIVRETGIEYNVLTSDLGLKEDLDPVTGFSFYLEKLKEAGLTDEEIDRMSQTNPSKLLGLK